MAAPSGTVWGSEVGSYGKIGLYVTTSNISNTVTRVTTEIWFWSKYTVSDTSNTFCFDYGTTSASTSKGSVSIKTTSNSGGGWSTTNQIKLGSYTYDYARAHGNLTGYCAAKLSGVEVVGGTMSVSTSFTVPSQPSYTVSYNANGGTSTPSSQTKWYDSNLTLAGGVSRTGYTFQGWATSSSGGVTYNASGIYSTNADVTLYAVWKAITHTVTYNANGGSGAPGNSTKTYGKQLTIPNAIPTRTNYNFIGWATSAYASAAQYLPGNSYWTADENMTLYAVWSLAYVLPRITYFSINRCSSDGTSSDDGTYALVVFKWACDKTVSSIKIEWGLADHGTYSDSINPSVSGTSGTVSQVIGSDNISTDNTYSIRVTVTDSGGSTTVKKSLSGTVYSIDILNGGNGVAFGKPAERAGRIDTAWDLRITSSARIFGIRTNGDELQAIETCNSNDNLTIGYGNYEIGQENNMSSDYGHFETNIYGNKINLRSASGAVAINDRPYGTNKILWSGGSYMDANQIAYLSEGILAQPHGVVLVFSEYNSIDSVVQDSSFKTFFIPKAYISSHAGCGMDFNMFGAWGAGYKYLYISNTSITGHRSNVWSGTVYGVTCSNTVYVLRYVIGL